MDPKHDEPKLSMDVGKKTTQLNLWIIVAIAVFVLISGFLIYHFLRNPAESTSDMQQRSSSHARIWTDRVC